MGYIHSVKITNTNETHLIEPLLYATAAGTSTALTANIDNFVLTPGAYVNIKVNTVNTNATLKISSTSAAYIYYNDAAIQANTLTEGNIYTFVYDGNHWVVLGDITGKNILIGTTQEWGNYYSTTAIPFGTVAIYTNRGTYTDASNNTITVPGIKISDGTTPIVDAPFVGDDVAAAIRNELNNHINNTAVHVSTDDRNFWNNKLNCDISGEILQFNRS